MNSHLKQTLNILGDIDIRRYTGRGNLENYPTTAL